LLNIRFPTQANDRFSLFDRIRFHLAHLTVYTNTRVLLGNSRRGSYIYKEKRERGGGNKKRPSGLCNSLTL
jgi:hypothetical protein